MAFVIALPLLLLFLFLTPINEFLLDMENGMLTTLSDLLKILAG